RSEFDRPERDIPRTAHTGSGWRPARHRWALGIDRRQWRTGWRSEPPLLHGRPERRDGWTLRQLTAPDSGSRTRTQRGDAALAWRPELGHVHLSPIANGMSGRFGSPRQPASCWRRCGTLWRNTAAA